MGRVGHGFGVSDRAPYRGHMVTPPPMRAVWARWPFLLIVAALVTALVLVSVGLSGQKGRDDATVTVAQNDPGDGESAVLSSIPFSEAWKRLNTSGREFVIAIAGDSTGNEPGEWVDRVSRTLAERFDRPLVEHPWSLEDAEYGSPIFQEADSRSNAALTVWNGSAPGKTAAYSLEHLDALIPVRPDVVIINHGLNNVRNPEGAVPEMSSLIHAIEQKWSGHIGYAVVLENPRFDTWQSAHRDVIDLVTEWAESNPNILPLDVYDAYLKSDEPKRLLHDDHLHPNTQGSALTAETILEALVDAGGQP